MIPELQLGIGVAAGIHKGWERDWLFWFDRTGDRFPTLDERIEQAQQQAQQAQQACVIVFNSEVSIQIICSFYIGSEIINFVPSLSADSTAIAPL
ncbi:MAG: hypothetical protein V7K57_22425 [Nostoc sp.]|uniref:hypothetical protein n=1 Tax=Nostoc sp. TaxID=1180 RepID=UPI002FF68605